MLALEPEIDAELSRVLEQLPDDGEAIGNQALGVRDVLRAHFLVANHFYLEGRGLGGIGPRDIGLLYSAIDRQHVAFGGKIKWVDRFDVCATLLYGLIKNHPFHDANKRTAFLSTLYQLHRMGWCPAVNEKQFEDFTVEIAEDKLSHYARFKEMTSNGDPDAPVKYLIFCAKTRGRSTKTCIISRIESYKPSYLDMDSHWKMHRVTISTWCGSKKGGNYSDFFLLARYRYDWDK